MFERGWKSQYKKIEKAREDYHKFIFKPLKDWRESVDSARKYNEEKVLSNGPTEITAARTLYLNKQSSLISYEVEANIRASRSSNVQIFSIG